MKHVRVLSLLVLFAATTLALGQTTPQPRAVIPFIGSTAGANGAIFGMEMSTFGHAGMRGTIYFHPAGNVAAFNDPYLLYRCTSEGNCTAGNFIQIAVCPASQTCGSGIGWAEIVPDEGSDSVVPSAFTRLFINNGGFPGGQAQFGAIVPEILVDDWQKQQNEPGAARTFFIPRVNNNYYRRNIGMTTLTDVAYTIYAKSTYTGRVIGPIQGTLPARFCTLQPTTQFTGPGVFDIDDVWLTIDSGNAIPFYTVTHNYTNEPTIVVGTANERTAVPPLPARQN